jgi:ketosteroid isomerase-like protein
MAQDKALIQGLNDKFAQAFNEGNAAAVAALYTDDAVILPPGGRDDERQKRHSGILEGCDGATW